MRLVCPNCDAEYEVDAAAIPEMGRDVQCSNCGHGWFQLSLRLEEELAAEAELFDPAPALPPEAAQDAAPSSYPDDDDPEIAPVDAAVAAAPARSLDESLMAVLRDEAQRETIARRAEAAPRIETQQEMGLNSAAAADPTPASGTPESQMPAAQSPDPDLMADHVARIKGIAQKPPKPQSRREMLPEIEEITTTLRASSERRSGDAGAITDSLTARAGSNGFRSGFVLMLVLALLVVAVYVMAPKLAVQIPATKGALTAYVAMIDAARLWWDGVLQSAIGLMRGTSG